MRETFTSGSVGRASGNRCLYPEEGRGIRPPRLLAQAFDHTEKLTVYTRCDIIRT